MKIQTWTRHTLTLEKTDTTPLIALVDPDHTVELDLSRLMGATIGSTKTDWLDREDLEALRCLITKALSFLPRQC